eukprot:SAG22_NODE_7446_length_739_cov_0.834375_1_plen_89_part_00
MVQLVHNESVRVYYRRNSPGEVLEAVVDVADMSVEVVLPRVGLLALRAGEVLETAVDGADTESSSCAATSHVPQSTQLTPPSPTNSPR